MKYLERKASIMNILSYLSLAGVLACIVFGMAYFSIVLLLFSFQLSNESNNCKLKLAIMQIMHNQQVLAGVLNIPTSEQ